MSLFSLFTPRRSAPVSRKPASRRLSLEALEDRSVPAVLPPALVLDLGPALLSHAAQENAAQPAVPFMLHKGEAVVVGINPDGSFSLAFTGTASHLGRFTGTGILVVAENGIDVSGSGTYTAANGDQLTFTYVAQLEAPLGTLPNAGTGSAIITGGTGRFADATGFVLTSVTNELEGLFEYQHDESSVSF